MIQQTQTNSFDLYDYAKYLDKLCIDVSKNMQENSKKIVKWDGKIAEREEALESKARHAEENLDEIKRNPKKAAKHALALKYSEFMRINFAADKAKRKAGGSPQGGK